jgi:malate permease and related proteins
MSALLLLALCLLLGLAFAYSGRAPEHLARNLNWWVINIALPAVVLELIPQLSFDWNLWYLAAAMWVVFVLTWICFAALGKLFDWPRRTIGALILSCGLCNTSFVGFPLIEALRGKDALKFAAIADQLGCFLMVAVGGSMVAAIYSGNRTHSRLIARKVLLFPPFIALLLAVVVGADHGWPALVTDVLARIGGTLTPIALFSVGLQLRLRMNPNYWPAFGIGLLWKLGFAPLIIYGLGLALGVGGMVLIISVLQAAMAPMITAVILAEQYELNPSLANMILGVGILLSMLTVPAWDKLF